MTHSINLADMLQKNDEDWSWDEFNEVLPIAIPLIWKHKDRFLNDGRLFLARFPESIAQMVTFRIGGLINCWMNSEAFQLSPTTEEAARHPMYVYNIGGFPMSGTCFASAVNLQTGELCRVSNSRRFVELFKKEPPYACGSFFSYIKAYQQYSGIEKYKGISIKPATFSELLSQLIHFD